MGILKDSLSVLNSLESLFCQKIAKGVEGGGDFSIHMLVCLIIAMAIEMLAGRSNMMKTTTSLSRRDGEPSSIGGFSPDLWIHGKRIWHAYCANLSTVP